MRRVVVIGLLAVVSTVFIMPGVTLPKTTLQAQQMADQVFRLLGTSMPEIPSCFAGLLPQLLKQNLSADISTVPHAHSGPLVVLIC